MTCTCGHVEDEHDDTFLASCLIEGCLCAAYDWDEEEDTVPGDDE